MQSAPGALEAGDRRLLAHIAALERLIRGPGNPSARERLTTALGPELTRALVARLTAAEPEVGEGASAVGA